MSPEIIKIAIISPRNTLNGGNLLLTRLGDDLTSVGHKINRLYIFRSSSVAHAIIFAPLQFLLAALSLIKSESKYVILTHYATYPFLFMPFVKKIIFIQDLEWLFWKASANPLLEHLFERIFTLLYLSCDIIISGNSYITSRLQKLGSNSITKIRDLPQIIQYDVSIKPKEVISCERTDVNRRYDLTFIIRKGYHKNKTMYLKLIKELEDKYRLIRLRILVIDFTCTFSIPPSSIHTYIILSTQQQTHLFNIYNDSRIFVLLSLHEGYGLPPLEAMYYGAIPIVTYNGGSQLYMYSFPALHLAASTSAADLVCLITKLISLRSDDYYSLRDHLQTSATQIYERSESARSTFATLFSDIISTH
jgi:glycosyltransferase involved in cell wall biosynthesis